MKPRTILFDFDGTICDSFEATIEVLNELSSVYRFRRADKEELPQLRQRSSRAILKHMKISFWKLPFVVARARKEMKSRIGGLKPFEGIRESLLDLKENGYELGILTSNSEANVSQFIHNHNLAVFSFVYSGSSIFGKHRLIKKLMKKKGILPTQLVYVGDETRDVEAARRSGIEVVSVTWGFNSKSALLAANPNVLVETPSTLATYFLMPSR